MKFWNFHLFFLYVFVCFDLNDRLSTLLSFAFKVVKVNTPSFRKSAIFVEKEIKNPQIFVFVLGCRIFLSMFSIKINKKIILK